MLFELLGNVLLMAFVFALIIWIYRQFKYAWAEHQLASRQRYLRQQEAQRREVERRESLRPRCQVVPEYDEATAISLQERAS